MLSIDAIGLGSNKITTEQLAKLVRFARTIANN